MELADALTALAHPALRGESGLAQLAPRIHAGLLPTELLCLRVSVLLLLSHKGITERVLLRLLLLLQRSRDQVILQLVLQLMLQLVLQLILQYRRQQWVLQTGRHQRILKAEALLLLLRMSAVAAIVLDARVSLLPTLLHGQNGGQRIDHTGIDSWIIEALVLKWVMGCSEWGRGSCIRPL